MSPAVAGATTGLGSLEALTPFLLIGLAFALVGLLMLGWGAWQVVRLLRSDQPQRRRLARRLVAGALLLGAAVLLPFADFNLYLLTDEVPEGETRIARGLVDRYFELDDGRAVYVLETDLALDPGDRVVVRTPGDAATPTLFEVYEATGGVFYRRRRRHEGKRFRLPLIPTRVSRWQLQERGPVAVLGPGWRAQDLGPEDQPLPWCCDPDWTRLLLARGADPNRARGFMLPLARALAPLGYLRDPERVAAAEASLQLLLAAGVDLDAVNGAGRTALHLAALRRDLFSARWLVERGADPSLRDARGQTPADLLRANLARGAALKPSTRREAQALLRRLDDAARRPRWHRRTGS